MTKHVIKFENLTAEFHELMEEYGLPIRLPEHRVRPSHTKHLTYDNLSYSNIAMINEIYADDFRSFGYEMMLAPSPPPLKKKKSAVESDVDAEADDVTKNRGGK